MGILQGLVLTRLKAGMQLDRLVTRDWRDENACSGIFMFIPHQRDFF